MSDSTIHYTDHQVTVDASADVVFGIVADIERWPQFFAPTVHAEYRERGAGEEVIALWATANEEVRHWTSRRHLDRSARRIRFVQQTPTPPLVSMGGEWVLKPLAENQTRVELKHDFQVVGDDPEAVAWVTRAVDGNSNRELRAVAEIGAMHERLDELMFSFTDEVEIGGTADAVYDFLWSAAEWPRRIPHVQRLDLRSPAPEVQLMEMDTRTPDGATHTTVSVRLGVPGERIHYKQTRTPALMRAHTGVWTLRHTPGGVLAGSQHTVILNAEAISTVLGPAASVADAGTFVRQALSRNSTTTLLRAKEFVEGGPA